MLSRCRRFISRSELDLLKQQNPHLYSEVIRRRDHEKEELAFAWITPRSLAKGFEGGILARILSVPNLYLVGARMYQPSNSFVDEYIQAHSSSVKEPFKPFVHFLNTDLRSSSKKQANHMLLLLFCGKDARAAIVNAIGSKVEYFKELVEGTASRSIRATYGYATADPSSGEIIEFQPGLVTSHSYESNMQYLRVFAKYAKSDGGILRVPDKEGFSNGMVLIKPDAMRVPSARIGHTMDLFSSTGLHLIGIQVFSMSLNQAERFYGHLQATFEDKLAPQLSTKLHERLDGAFEFKVPQEVYDISLDLMKKEHARNEVYKVLKYMTGRVPTPEMTEEEKKKRGPARCLAVMYRGRDAINTIRSKLGATDPSKAAVGTIRFDYAYDKMRNTAHASDSLDNMKRECEIIDFGYEKGQSAVEKIIHLWCEE